MSSNVTTAFDYHPTYMAMLASKLFNVGSSMQWDMEKKVKRLQEIFDEAVPVNTTLQGHELMYLSTLAKIPRQQRRRGFKYILSMVIPAPAEAMPTPLLSKLAEQKMPLGFLKIAINPNGNLFLQSFYIFPNIKSNSSYASTEERNVFRGMGRKLLCHAILELQVLGLTNFDNNTISLEASGGECNAEDESRITDIDVAAVMEKYANYFEEVLSDMESEGISLHSQKAAHDLRHVVCAIIDNAKLVKYYTNTYGFKVDDDTDATAVKMTATLVDLIKACM